MKKIISLFLSLFFFCQISSAFAAGLVGNCGTGDMRPCNLSDIGPVFKSGINFVLKLAVILIGLVITYVGIKLITSKNKAAELSEAKKHLTNVVIGVVILTMVASGSVYVALLKGLGVQQTYLDILNKLNSGSLITTDKAPVSASSQGGTVNAGAGTTITGQNADTNSQTVGVVGSVVGGVLNNLGNGTKTSATAESATTCPAGQEYVAGAGCLRVSTSGQVNSASNYDSECASQADNALCGPTGSGYYCMSNLCKAQ